MTAKKPKFTIAGIDPETRANQGHEFEIVDPTTCEDGENGLPDYGTGSGTGMFITVVGKESTAFKQAARRKVNEARKRLMGNKKSPTIEDDISDSIDLYAACTNGWRGVVLNEDEGELPFTPENVRKLYAFDFVRAQVEAQIMKREVFTPG